MTCYLNNVGLIFGDGMYLVQDMFFSLVLGLCIANTPPHDTLSERMPPRRLFSFGLMAKLLMQLAIFPAMQAITLQVLYSQSWFEKFEAGDDPLTQAWSHEGAALNIIALAQLMIASVVVTIGRPFRHPWYTNTAHILVMTLQAAYITFLLFNHDETFNRLVTNKPAPDKFQGILIALILLNIIISAIGNWIAELFFLFDEL